MSGRIVVGVDGSDQSVAALRWAAAEAHLRGITLKVVTVWEFPHAAYMTSPGAILPAELCDELDRRAHEIQAEAIAEALPEGSAVDVDAIVVEGVPAQELVDRSEGADMLVLGSRGRGGFRGLLLGSIGHQCTTHARCPVVIVRDLADRNAHAA